MVDFFDDIQGQKRVKSILSKFSIELKIPHALLFSGIEGIGKEKTAIRFAQLVNSNAVNKNEKQRVSKLISNLAEPYIKFIIPLPRGKNETDADSSTDKLNKDEIELIQEELEKKSKNPYYKFSIPKANTIKINSIREIKKFVSLDFSEIPYRFIIITSAHMMNEAAQNALLKNLEEPPAGVIFILITSLPNFLRETIRSRCWKINFDPLSIEQLTSILTNEFDLDKNTAEAAAPFAEGSTSVALELIDKNIRLLSEKTISILRYSFGRKYHSAFGELSELLKDEGTKNIQLIIKMIITWLNDLQKHKLDINSYFFKDYAETLEKFNTKFPDVELNKVVMILDRLSSYTVNNLNNNILASNIVFELSNLASKKAG